MGKEFNLRIDEKGSGIFIVKCPSFGKTSGLNSNSSEYRQKVSKNSSENMYHLKASLMSSFFLYRNISVFLLPHFHKPFAMSLDHFLRVPYFIYLFFVLLLPSDISTNWCSYYLHLPSHNPM